MKLRNPLLLALALGIAALGSPAVASDPQAPPTSPTVSVSANGTDVRTVLHDLFTQTKQNYVIEPGIRYALYLSLDKVDFDEALGIICHLAKLKADKQDGIYYVTEDTPPPASQAQPAAKPKTQAPPADPPQPEVTQATLKAKRVTTRLARTDIRKVFATIAKEAGVPIVVDPSVPACKMDAFLEKTSLKYALDQIAGAAKLRYRIVEHQSILIYSDETENRVAVSS